MCAMVGALEPRMPPHATSSKPPGLRDGVVVIDKPVGPTSHDMVSRVRKRLGQRSVGHAGTLDPFASGLLVVAVGQGTKLVPYLTAAQKTYTATLLLGAATETFDPTAAITSRAPLSDALISELSRGVDGPLLCAALETERARSEQTPPMHSAVHVGGTRAYQLARQGVEVDLPARHVQVHSLTVDSCTLHTEDRTCSLTLSLTVTKGYYVRALARDLATSLGTVGYLTALRRTAAAPFTIAEASALEDVGRNVLSLAEAARRILPVVTLTDKGVIDAGIGRTIEEADRSPHIDVPAAWFSTSGELVAVGEGARVLRGFPSTPGLPRAALRASDATSSSAAEPSPES